jgi:nicotinamidase-related amidase
MDKYTQPEWQHSALITIDVQEDFSRQNASAYISGTDKIISTLAPLVMYYRNRNWPIIHVIRLYQMDGSNVDLCRRSMVEQGTQIVAPESEGAEPVQELKPDRSTQLDFELLLNGDPQQIGENEWILYKPRWGAFYQTYLEEMLKKLSVNTVVVSGCNFPNCPRTTIYEASERDFRIVLVKNGVSGLYERAEQELENIDVALYKADEIIEMCT